MSFVAIITPVYKPVSTVYEAIAFVSISDYIKKYNYDWIIIQPESLSSETFGNPGISKYEYFPAEYFRSIADYSRLCLSPDFYERFQKYKYILIAQTDSMIVSDEKLEDFCNYDYIGAPWVFDLMEHPEIRNLVTFPYNKNSFINNKIKKYFYEPFIVGNGGFSLRNTEKFLEITTRFSREASDFLLENNAPEDSFWSLVVPGLDRTFRKAPFKVSIQFSVESQPEYCYNSNDCHLPLGTHAWYKHDEAFWNRMGIVKKIREKAEEWQHKIST
jgi:hypothetical protein